MAIGLPLLMLAVMIILPHIRTGGLTVKTGKIVLIVVAVVVVAVAALLFVSLGSMDKLIQAGIEKYGPEMTKADITLDKLSIDLTNGQASLLGLSVGNPEGFNTEYLTHLDEVKVSLDLDSITSDPVVVKEILIQSPVFIYELAPGGTNLDAILRNVRDYVNEGAGEKGQNKTAGPKMIINDVYIRDGTVSVSLKAMNGKKMLTSPLPEIHLQDIGKKEGGATPGEVAEKIIAGVRSSAVSAVAKLNLDAVADKTKQAGTAIKEGLGEAGEKLKGLFR